MAYKKVKNFFKSWNRSESTSIRGDSPDLATNRIFDKFFKPENIELKTKFSKQDSIFTMGSCFAREIESAFLAEKFDILSMNDKVLKTDDFKDNTGRVRTGFFHRYNLGAMLQEFQRAFDETDFKDNTSLLIKTPSEEYVDLNYTDQPIRCGLEGVLHRRSVGKELVQNVKHAQIVIITLGLTEAWFYIPDNLYVNAVPADILVKHKEDFELRQISYKENYAMLESLYALLSKHHENGNFHLVITVSPVPLRHTFTAEDIVISNMYAKSTLRAVAGEFSMGKENVSYFPSYEIAMYSDRSLVWRPDRIHINPDCVRFIVKTFRENYIQASE